MRLCITYFGSGAISDKMVLVRIVEKKKFILILGQVWLGKYYHSLFSFLVLFCLLLMDVVILVLNTFRSVLFVCLQ